MIVQIIIALLSFSLFGVGVKYIFSPHYRFQLNKKKFAERQKGIEELYIIYKEHIQTVEKLPPFVLDAKVNTCLGTDRYDYRLIFLLIKGNFATVESSAKRIMDAWPFLDLEYSENDIRLINYLSLTTLRFLRKIILSIYLILCVFLAVLIISFKYFGDWFFVFLTCIGAVMYLCILVGSKFSTILSIERLINNP